MSAEIKIAASTSPVVHTFVVGGRDLLLIDGSLSRRIRVAVGSQQLSLAGGVNKVRADPNSELSRLALVRDYKVFKVEVVGTPAELLSLGDDISFQIAVLAYEGDRRAEGFALAEESVEKAKENMPASVTDRQSEAGLPAGLTPDHVHRAYP